MWKEEIVVACFKVIPQHFPGGIDDSREQSQSG
jgi:hypothetical protein